MIARGTVSTVGFQVIVRLRPVWWRDSDGAAWRADRRSRPSTANGLPLSGFVSAPCACATGRPFRIRTSRSTTRRDTQAT